MELIAFLIAFAVTVACVAIFGLIFPDAPKPAERKPNPTPYVGPHYNAHGREIVRVGRSVL